MNSAVIALIIIWIVSGCLGIYIARKRNVQLGVLWDIAFCFLGPLVIPFIFLAKPKNKSAL
jgi:hypothetical protein